MMPDLRAPVRALGPRRITGQVVKQEPVGNGRVAQAGQSLLRASFLLTRLDPREIDIKPEGERHWKWWRATGFEPLQLGWFILPDNDKRIKYRVMSDYSLGQARVFVYDFVEAPR